MNAGTQVLNRSKVFVSWKKVALLTALVALLLIVAIQLGSIGSSGKTSNVGEAVIAGQTMGTGALNLTESERFSR